MSNAWFFALAYLGCSAAATAIWIGVALRCRGSDDRDSPASQDPDHAARTISDACVIDWPARAHAARKLRKSHG